MSLYHALDIGSLHLEGNLFLAPVAGYSDSSFRFICTKWGACFSYTEMVSAEALSRGNTKTMPLLESMTSSPYAVQLFGSVASSIYKAVEVVLRTTKASLIDINCGCPVAKIQKSFCGAALMKEPQRLFDIVQAALKCIHDNNKDIPVSVKIRSGIDNNQICYKEVAEAAIKAGASAVTLHPRTRAQGYEGKADWDKIACLVDYVHNLHYGAKVFGSGDLFSPEDASSMLKTTNCDAIMFARGALGNPFVFSQTKDYLETGSFSPITPAQKLSTAMEELRLLCKTSGEKSACLNMRKRFCAYTKGIQGSSLLRQKIVNASCIEDYKNIVRNAL